MLQRGPTLRAVSSASNHWVEKQTGEIAYKYLRINSLDGIVQHVVTGELALHGCGLAYGTRL
jgi:hypothetical protein